MSMINLSSNSAWQIKKYSFSKHKNDLLVFGNTISQGGLCFVECVKIKFNSL